MKNMPPEEIEDQVTDQDTEETEIYDERVYNMTINIYGTFNSLIIKQYGKPHQPPPPPGGS